MACVGTTRQPFLILIPFNRPIIQIIVASEIGKEEAAQLTIIANDAQLFDATGSLGKWGIKFRHPDSPYGHDKNVAISSFRNENPDKAVIFCGDGYAFYFCSDFLTMLPWR